MIKYSNENLIFTSKYSIIILQKKEKIFFLKSFLTKRGQYKRVAGKMKGWQSRIRVDYLIVVSELSQIVGERRLTIQPTLYVAYLYDKQASAAISQLRVGDILFNQCTLSCGGVCIIKNYSRSASYMHKYANWQSSWSQKPVFEGSTPSLCTK